MKINFLLGFGVALSVLSLSVSAAQPPNSNIEYISPSDLSSRSSTSSGSQHGHIRQRLAYGKGYRYGHSVSGPTGNITIWSASPNRIHGSTPIVRGGHRGIPRSATAFGPKIIFKPQYGKTQKKAYGK